MKRLTKLVIGIGLPTIAIGCQANPAVPALLISKADQTSVSRAIAAATNAPKVTLGEDAFMTSNTISIINGKPMGRDLRQVNHFLLWKQNNTCFIEHKGTGKKILLDSTNCKEK